MKLVTGKISPNRTIISKKIGSILPMISKLLNSWTLQNCGISKTKEWQAILYPVTKTFTRFVILKICYFQTGNL